MQTESLKCKVMAPAKINLSLDITGKREDGYHLLKTVMQTIKLFDTITVSIEEKTNENDSIIKITADKPKFPCDSRNTCYKAAEKFIFAMSEEQSEEFLGTNKFLLIHIEKKIPQAAGLAGGSVDAAAVLVALNNLSNQMFSEKELSQIGVRVGADVPFCLTGGTCLCEGIGEILSPITPLKEIPVVLVKPDFGVSTPWVFSRINLNYLGKRPDTQSVIDAILRKDLTSLFDNTANVLESVTLPSYPVLLDIKNALTLFGAKGAMMSGSGPTVFGVFETREQANDAAEKMNEIPYFSGYTTIVTETFDGGPLIS